jgi:hypothetical protein
MLGNFITRILGNLLSSMIRGGIVGNLLFILYYLAAPLIRVLEALFQRSTSYDQLT